MINKFLCFAWGHTWVEEIEDHIVSALTIVKKDKAVMKSRIITTSIVKCKHCGTVENNL